MTTDDDRPRSSTTTPPTGARLLSVGATLDAAVAAALRREMRALLARSADPIVVDLTAVRATDRTAASEALRDLASEAGEADVDLRVARDPAAREVNRALLGDERLFEVYPDLDAALDGATGASAPDDGAGRPAAPGER
ncbi:STAS domain-containing protein [Actinomycetospora aeridis]|uniref:STAS domain-containing protein n=1 Tax=Actinomycetospora aeridis TaxID=3129231 RepID=A0ABU8NDN7_9PSEU